MAEFLSENPRWWQWPTVLSLDAPAVAGVWQWFFGSIAGSSVGWPETIVLGTSVWLAYAADRWFEAWRVAPKLIRTPRHRFYQRYRWPVAIVWLAVLIGDVTVAFAELSGRELVAGAMLLIPTLGYLLSHQLIHREHRWRPPKEMCVAFLIAAGASVFVLPSATAGLWPVLGIALLFMALCFTNVGLIAVWEQEVDQVQGQLSIARQFRHGARLGRAAPWVLVAISVLCALLRSGLPTSGLACVGGAALLLGLVDSGEHRLGWQCARVLADLVLLTPATMLIAHALRSSWGK